MTAPQQETWWIKQVAYIEAAEEVPWIGNHNSFWTYTHRHAHARARAHTHTHTHTHTQRYLPWFPSGYFSYSTSGYFPVPLQSSNPFCDRIIVVTDIRTGRFPIVSVFIKIVRKLQLLPPPDRTVELWNLPWVHYIEFMSYLVDRTE